MDELTLEQTLRIILSILGIATTVFGTVLATIKFMGKQLLKNIIEEAVDKRYEKVLKLQIEELIENNSNSLEESMIENINSSIKSHHSECRNENTQINDNRYLLRQEFKMYIENQNKNNERLEEAISGIRNLCDQILFKLNS